jgi:hypothetical protein
MSQDIELQQVASQLQITSADLWTFSINITSPLRIHFPLLNATELRHYHITYNILLPSMKFWFSFSSSLSVAFVVYMFSACLL